VSWCCWNSAHQLCPAQCKVPVSMSIPWALESLLCIDTMALFWSGLDAVRQVDWLSGYWWPWTRDQSNIIASLFLLHLKQIVLQVSCSPGSAMMSTPHPDWHWGNSSRSSNKQHLSSSDHFLLVNCLPLSPGASDCFPAEALLLFPWWVAGRLIQAGVSHPPNLPLLHCLGWGRHLALNDASFT